MIESQKFVMTNLRNGIDYLKNTCKDVGNDKEMPKIIVIIIIIKIIIIIIIMIIFRGGDNERLPMGGVGSILCL